MAEEEGEFREQILKEVRALQMRNEQRDIKDKAIVEDVNLLKRDPKQVEKNLEEV